MPSQKTTVPALSAGANSRGLNLARFRKDAGVSLEQIAAQTKISLRFLRAIEEEQFDKLPGGIFNTSYLRQYAAAIGYDESELLAHYHGQSNSGGSASKGRRKSGVAHSFLDRWLKMPAEARR